MKRLFQVNDSQGKPVIGGVKNDGPVMYFENKKLAKEYRDTFPKGYTVSPGPDHKGLLSKKSRGHTFKNSARYRATAGVS